MRCRCGPRLRSRKARTWSLAGVTSIYETVHDQLLGLGGKPGSRVGVTRNLNPLDLGTWCDFSGNTDSFLLLLALVAAICGNAYRWNPGLLTRTVLLSNAGSQTAGGNCKRWGDCFGHQSWTHSVQHCENG